MALVASPSGLYSVTGSNASYIEYTNNDSDLSSKNIPHISRSHLLPLDTFDTHVHVFDPTLGPYFPKRSYTPENAPYSSLLDFSRSISAVHKPANLVVVQPSPYGTDNRVLLSILQQAKSDGMCIRGIAVVDIDAVSHAVLSDMHELGVRGLRLNLQADGHKVNLGTLESILKQSAEKIRHLPGWKLQLFAPGYIWQELYPIILNLPVMIIADHCGGLLAASMLPLNQRQKPLQQPGFEALINLAKQSRVLIKVSGLYRSSSELSTDFADMGPLIQAMAEEVPDSLIWGSDWPHTGEGKDRLQRKNLDILEPFRDVQNLNILKHLKDWVGNEQTWMKMMVDNPRKAYH